MQSFGQTRAAAVAVLTGSTQCPCPPARMPQRLVQCSEEIATAAAIATAWVRLKLKIGNVCSCCLVKSFICATSLEYGRVNPQTLAGKIRVP